VAISQQPDFTGTGHLRLKNTKKQQITVLYFNKIPFRDHSAIFFALPDSLSA